MYILINRDNMRITYVHSNVNCIANVAWIELQNNVTQIFPLCDATGFCKYTDMELKILYRNITGKDNHSFTRSQIKQVLYDLCKRMQESDINEIESDIQAEFIKEGDERKWKYVRGAKRPAIQCDIFESECIHVESCRQEEDLAVAGNLPALKRAPAPPKRPAAAKTGNTNTSAAGNGPKRGTARAIIWSVADEKWEKAGKPTDKASVLQLRKEIMDYLEKEECIKRASASSELGKWHKERAPF